LESAPIGTIFTGVWIAYLTAWFFEVWINRWLAEALMKYLGASEKEMALGAMAIDGEGHDNKSWRVAKPFMLYVHGPGRLGVEGWQEKIDKSATEISKEFQDLGAGSILFTNVDVEGLLGGFYTDPVVDLVNSVDIPVVYSGGVTTLDDLKQLQSTGAKGVVIGSALYKDKIKLEDALKYQDIK
jgi:imidazole glycerol phosphate synthase subunit HisF